MIPGNPSSESERKKNASKASGSGMSQMLIRVTTPRFDCENNPSKVGPTPQRATAAVSESGKRAEPVSMTSPVGRTTSMPQRYAKWSP